jgi:hypothetical protein
VVQTVVGTAANEADINQTASPIPPPAALAGSASPYTELSWG